MTELQHISSFTVEQEIENLPLTELSHIFSFTVEQRITALEAPANLRKEEFLLKWDYSEEAIIDGFRIYKDNLLFATIGIKEYILFDKGIYYVTAFTENDESAPSNEYIYYRLGGKGWAKAIAIGEQENFETGVPVTDYVEFISEELKEEIDELISAGITIDPALSKRENGAEKISGPIDVEMIPQGALGKLLKHTFGTVNTIELVAGQVYEHTFTLADILPAAGLSIVVDRDIEAKKYIGCKITQFTFVAAAKAILTGKFDFAGHSVESATELTPVLPTINPLTFRYAVLKLDDMEQVIKNFLFTINNKLNTDNYGFSVYVTNIENNDFREVGGSFNKEFDATVLPIWTKFKNGAEATLEAIWEGGIINGAHKYSLKFIFPRIFYNSFTPGTGGRVMSDVSIPFKAFRKADKSEYEVKAVLKTSDASY